MKNNTDIETSAVLKALAYYDVFDYPLTYDEIVRFSKGLSESQVQLELNQLEENSVIYKSNQFFSLKKEMSFFEKRIEGNQRMIDFTKKAIRRAKLIGKFPFVRGVFISGSFSKGCMSIDGDVDYFVITKNNRMWLARTLLILYKKTFLFNSRKYFCVNYFLGDKELQIDQKNIFTATELFTIKPIVNRSLYKRLLKENHWIEEYYDLDKLVCHNVIEYKTNSIKSIIESFFNNSIGEKIDLYFMKFTFKRWERKFPDLPKIDFNIAFKSTRNVSKHHPSNFQKHVLESYNKRINNLKNV